MRCVTRAAAPGWTRPAFTDNLWHVLGFLDHRAIGTVRGVCKTWRDFVDETSQESEHWRSFMRKTRPFDALTPRNCCELLAFSRVLKCEAFADRCFQMLQLEFSQGARPLLGMARARRPVPLGRERPAPTHPPHPTPRPPRSALRRHPPSGDRPRHATSALTSALRNQRYRDAPPYSPAPTPAPTRSHREPRLPQPLSRTDARATLLGRARLPVGGGGRGGATPLVHRQGGPHIFLFGYLVLEPYRR